MENLPVCRVCATTRSKYACPRCNIPYCSVSCYKDHGQECTEEFYRDQVRGVISLQAGQESDGVGEVLRMMAKQGLGSGVEGGPEGVEGGLMGDEDVYEEADELPGEDMAARSAILRQAATTDPASLSLDLLSEGERAQFIEDVAAGRVQPDGVQSWAPWWDATEATHVAAARLQVFPQIQELQRGSVASQHATESKSPSETACGEGLPQALPEGIAPEPSQPLQSDQFTPDLQVTMLLPCVLRYAAAQGQEPVTLHYLHSPACAAIPPFSRLTPSTFVPSPALRFMLVELLLAYVRLHRHWLGDQLEDAPAASAELLALSPVLSEDRRYESVREACCAGLEAAHSAASLATIGTGQLTDALGALRDVLSLLRCRHYVTDALWDARGVVVAAIAAMRPSDPVISPSASKIHHVAARRSTTGASPTPRRTPSGSRMLVSVERKLLFYCSWSVSVLDTLALRSLRTDVIQYAEEMSSTWRAGAREPSHRQGRDVLSTAVGASSAEVEPGASLASAAATSNKSGSTGVLVHEVS